MKNIAAIATCISAIALAPIAAAAGADLRAATGDWANAHEKEMDAAGDLLREGESSKANGQLVDLANKDGGGAAAFVIGNTIYKNDPANSYLLHERALKAFPDEPAVALEMAMDQHRKGEYAGAIVNYRKVVESGIAPHFASLLADCYVRTGQLKLAVEAWRNAGFRQTHTEIDFAIYEIYGKLSPYERRGSLLGRAKAGDVDALVEAIVLDVNFEDDWWNKSLNAEMLDLDLKTAAKLLGEKDPRYVHLAAYASAAKMADEKKGDFRKVLVDAKLILGPDGELPESSRLARAVIEFAVIEKSETSGNLFRSFQSKLRARAEKHDVHALHALCWMAADAELGDLDELDALGWKNWKDPEFAGSYIVGLHLKKKLSSPTDPELAAALKALPEDNFLNQIRLDLAGDAGENRELLVDAIKAEYRKLSPGLIIQDSYTLNSLFTRLAGKL